MEQLIALFILNNALWMVAFCLFLRSRPRYNSKEGQFILEETENINGGAGTVKYHLRQAELLQQAANEHLREAQEEADIMQVRANLYSALSCGAWMYSE